jgi:ribosomal protein L16 Arg81 hydroxylase
MQPGLESVFSPLSVETFTHDYLGRRFLLCRGSSDRWQHLLTWADVNAMLSRMRVAGTRVRLMKDGAAIDRQRYMRNPQDPDGTELIAGVVEQEIHDGATLIVDHIHELSARIAAIAALLEEAFRVVAGANAYIAIGGHLAFGLHWDTHDTLILQISGRKRWRVFEPTVVHPLASDGGRAVPEPSGPPIWEGVLNAGDMLYMPRGWWHAAVPDGGDTVHVTFSLRHATGIDLINWLAGRLKARAIARSDLPTLADRATQENHVARLLEELGEVAGGGAIEEFLRFIESKRLVSRPFNLPPQSPQITVSDTQKVILSTQRALLLQPTPDGSQVQFEAGGRRWTCSPALQAALALLDHVHGRSLETLSDTAPTASRPELKRVLTALLIARVIRIVPMGEPDVVQHLGLAQEQSADAL